MPRLGPALRAAGPALALVAAACAQVPPAHALQRLELQPGDRVAILGNAFADRLQHSGYLEALIIAHYPGHNLVFRNLAAAGDEVASWHRSENFGSRDAWLAQVQADVVLACYGFGESFGGEEGLARFRADLAAFLKQVRAQHFSAKEPPRVVLFGPAANERHPDPDHPDPDANNRRLERYSAAMAEVAGAEGVPFIDLFTLSRRLQAEAARDGESLTINGHYFSEAGDRRMAPALFEALFGQPAPALNEPLRLAINAKNREWHQRYRTVDGYNVYGGRSRLSYESGPQGPKISNYEVMQQEMSQRDVLTARLDRRVWALARGEPPPTDAQPLPPVTPVRSNKPGPNPDESHTFLSGEDAIARMTVHSGLRINLYADEQQFPPLINPVQMAWDTRGRLWVAAWRNYPERTPESTTGDQLLVFEDTNLDGRADRMTIFADDLNCPTGFQFYRDGVLLVQAPDLWFLRDTNGDGRADTQERVLMGLDSADSHHTANALCLDPAGGVYLSDGVFHRTQVETAYGVTRNLDAAIYRFEPRTGHFETYIPYGFANPHGRVFDRWGDDLVTDATGNNTYFGPAISGRLDYPHKHPGIQQFWDRPSRPCPGTGLLSSRHFPESFQGNFLNCNVISFQGIYRVAVHPEGSGLQGETLEPLVSSADPNFRPTAVNVGPDGAVYFADWHNPIIGHMQHHLRDPSRDHQHGRIYRLTCVDRALLRPVAIHGAPIPVLLDFLKEPEDNVRERAKIELGNHPTPAVLAALGDWLGRLDPKDPDVAHHRAEALWLHQWHHTVNLPLLRQQLQSPEPRARAAAGRVLCYWRDQVPDALALLQTLAADEHPRVRLEAVRSASYFENLEAVEVALQVVRREMDLYLDYTLTETLRQLEPVWRRALAQGASLATSNAAGMRRLLAKLSTTELLHLPPGDGVQFALLQRPDLVEATRHEVLADLAKRRGVSRVVLVLQALEEVQGRDATAAAQFARLLPLLPAAELRTERDRLSHLAGDGATAPVRQSAWAARILCDGAVAPAWSAASANAGILVEFLEALPLLYDPQLRSEAQARLLALVGATTGDIPVQRAAIRALGSLSQDPDATLAALAGLIRSGREVPTAARALRGVPRAAWTPELAGPVAAALVAWARGVPAAARADADCVDVVQVAGELAGWLSADTAARLHRDLREVRVPVFIVRTVREQMRFDLSRLVVEAGKQFSLRVENDDFMPHNLVVLKPGGRERVGPLADRMKPDALDDQGRAYVPRSQEVLDATRLLEPGQQQALQIQAPQVEGVYEFCCTFPEHWRVMWGQLVVTRDVETYLRAHPQAPEPSPASTHHHSSIYE